MNFLEKQVLEKIKDLIDDKFLETSEIIVKENKGSYNSLVVLPQDTAYRSGTANEKLLARIKTSGNIQFIALPNSVREVLDRYDVPYLTIKSDDFLRISIEDFLLEGDIGIEKAINALFLNILNFPSFGCCSRYKECSVKGSCVHPDILYASAACQYKKHLDVGEVFYK